MCLPITVNNPSALLEKGVFYGHEYEITNNGRGFRCGYVKVQKEHPWFGKTEEELPYIEIHGGITFLAYDKPCDKDGTSDNGYWLGFDCAHCFDAPDPKLEGFKDWGLVQEVFKSNHVWTQDEVREECKRLARQAAEAEKATLTT